MKVGDKVRVRGDRHVAVIESEYTDIKGGVRLDREIQGFHSWNKKDLVKVPRRKVRKR